MRNARTDRDGTLTNEMTSAREQPVGHFELASHRAFLREFRKCC
jgi:hypothetical protein